MRALYKCSTGFCQKVQGQHDAYLADSDDKEYDNTNTAKPTETLVMELERYTAAKVNDSCVTDHFLESISKPISLSPSLRCHI